MAYNYCIGSIFDLTGTIGVDDYDVIGAGTTFLTEVLPGDYLTAEDTTRAVATVTSGSTLTTTNFWPVTQSGLTATRVRLANLETDLGLPAPRGYPFANYSQPITLGDGSVRGAGWKTVDWTWDFLSRAHRDILRAYCPGASAEVVIRTRTVDSADSYAYYRAQMIWPQAEDPQAGRRLDFTLKFQRMTIWP